MDSGRLPLPVHHGHVVAELRQPRHRPGAAHQDTGEGTVGRGGGMLRFRGDTVVVCDVGDD